MIGVALGLVVLHRLAARRPLITWTAPLAWFLAFVAWAVAALPSAADQGLAVRQTLLYAGEAAFATAVVTACDTPDKVRRALSVLTVVAVGIAVSAMGSIGQLRAQFGASLVEGRAQGVFNQPNELGTFCAVALLTALALALGGTTQRGRRLASAAAAVVLVPLLLSLSRGSWIGVTLGVAVLALMLPRWRRLLAVVGIPAVALALVLGSFAPSRPEVQVVGQRARSIVGERNPYDDRPHIWAEGRRQFVADPWTGQGPGSFPVVAARSGAETVTVYPVHAHNLLLTFAAELGLPAVLLVVGLVAHTWGRVRRALRANRAAGRARDTALIAGLAAAMVAVLGQGAIDYSLRAAVIFTEISGVLGALLAMCRMAPRLAP
jgi:O-antigen ligase